MSASRLKRKGSGLVSVPIALLIGTMSLSGCNGEPTGECFEGASGFSDTPLPIAMAMVQIDCVGQPEPPSVEVWAGAADSVLIGTVTSVCPHWEPALVTVSGADPPYVSAAECTGFIEGGAQVTLTEVETLYGADLGSEVTITLGHEVVGRYFPFLSPYYVVYEFSYKDQVNYSEHRSC